MLQNFILSTFKSFQSREGCLSSLRRHSLLQSKSCYKTFAIRKCNEKARHVTMLGRNTPRLMKQFAPPVLGFILGYIWRSLDSPPQQEETSLENVSRNCLHHEICH